MAVNISQPARNLREELAASAKPGGIKRIGGRFLFGQGDLLGDLPAGGVVYLSSAGLLTASSLFQFDGTNLGIGGAPASTSRLTVSGALKVSGGTAVGASAIGTWAFESAVSRFFVGDGTGYSYAFAKRVSSTTTDLLTITDGGNVLIGTATALGRFTIQASGANTDTLAVGNSNGNRIFDIRAGGTPSRGIARLYDNGTQKFELDPLGLTYWGDSGAKVAIGKSSATATLDVEGTIRPKIYTVATLPSASGMGNGTRSHVSDATAPTFGATVAGGGAVSAPVYSDGSNWKVG